MMKTFPFFLALAMAVCLTGCDNKKSEPENVEVFVDSLPEETVAGENLVEDTENETPMDTLAATEETTDVAEPVKKVFARSADGYVNVRRSPSVKSEILGKLTTDGPGANYVATEGDWYQIEYDGVKGYVKNTYATFEREEAVSSTASKSSGKVYYVVKASCESLESAKKVLGQIPDAFICPVYKAVVDGKVKYRLCESCFTSMEKAKAHIREIESYLGKQDFWVWEADGLAECIYCPITPKGDRAKPLSPK